MKVDSCVAEAHFTTTEALPRIVEAYPRVVKAHIGTVVAHPKVERLTLVQYRFTLEQSRQMLFEY